MGRHRRLGGRHVSAFHRGLQRFRYGLAPGATSPLTAHSPYPPTFATIHFLIRKLAHCSEYAIFGLLLYHSFEPRHPERWDTRGAFGALLIAGLFSLADEYHQSFVPGRTASLVDCGIDTAGALLGLVLLYGGRRLQASHSSKAAENESKAEMKKGTGGE